MKTIFVSSRVCVYVCVSARASFRIYLYIKGFSHVRVPQRSLPPAHIRRSAL